MRKLIFLEFIFVITSCTCKNKDSENKQNSVLNDETKIPISEELILKDTIGYLSGAYGSALMQLIIIPNGTFEFYMSIYRDSMQDTERESDKIELQGLWNGNEKTILLNFTEKEEVTLNLNALFVSNYKEENEFIVIDQNTVEIDYKLGKINIWGIKCYTIEK